MAFQHSPDRVVPEPKLTLTRERAAAMRQGDPIDLRIPFGKGVRYQCPPCGRYFALAKSPHEESVCPRCRSRYRPLLVDDATGQVKAFFPVEVRSLP